MKNLKSNYSHLDLYIYEETLFVWSKTTKSLYAFSNYFAALYFSMEETLELPTDLNEEANAIAKTIQKLLTNKEEKTTYDKEPLIKVPSIPQKLTKFSHKTYALYGSYFSLDLDESLTRYIEASFTHLLSSTASKSILYHFEVLLEEDKSYVILANNVKLETVSKKENVLPVLLDFIRIVHYENSDFLVSIHAAVLAKNEKTLILPGVSGAGKSTLSSYLMYNGYALYSDEVTTIDLDFNINSLALCTTIKEPSWKVLSSFTQDINNSEIHERFDKQAIKFLAPPSVERDSLNAKGAYIVFPTYKSGSTTQVSQIDIVQAIALITQAQYHLSKPESAEITKTFLEFLTSCRLYTLVYSDLKSAQDTIEKILQDD
ncbi:MAG: hypothetical protein U9O86_02525 [Campylobacterota bacterium]|nr:hypothetical protein [Campylobacterota bacterium]